MRLFIGVDIAKEVHWACAIDQDARLVFNRAMANDPAAIDAFIAEIAAARPNRETEVVVALDMLGGAAALLCAMLAEAGIAIVHTPGLAVNRARQGAPGGETKSDPKDAAVIAEMARTRRDLRPVDPASELDAELRLLVSRRRDLVVDQTRRAARIRPHLTALFLALERRVDPTTKTGLVFLSLFAAPDEIRSAGAKRIARRLARAGRNLRGVEALAADAVAAARAQRVAIPGAGLRARIVKELSLEALGARDHLAAIERDIEQRLARHPDATLIRSLPGMGVTLTAEFLALTGRIDRFRDADSLAAAAGLAPVLRQSVKSRATRRAYYGDKALKRVLYQVAFNSRTNPDSRAFYQRKRREGKRHHQAVIALARRRGNVLWAVLQTRTPFQPNFKLAA